MYKAKKIDIAYLKKLLASDLTLQKSGSNSWLVAQTTKLCAFFEGEKQRGFEYYNWLYTDNPAGPGMFYFAHNHLKEMVGQFVLVPVNMKIGGRCCRAAVSVNSITHPMYRGRGIFFVLAQDAFLDRAQNKFDVIFGSPNSKNYSNALNAGFKDLASLPIFIKINYPPNLLFEFLNEKLPFLGMNIFYPLIKVICRLVFFAFPFLYFKRVKIKEIGCADKRFDALWEQISDNFKNICIRNRDFVSWRFFKNPRVEYTILTAEQNDGQLKGYIVLLEMEMSGDKLGIIMDALADNPATYKLLISAALKYFKKIRTYYIMILSNTSFINKLLYRFGFRRFPIRLQKNPFRFVYMNYSNKINEEIIKNIENWHITFADFDMF